LTGLDGVSHAVADIGVQADPGHLAYLVPKTPISTVAPGSVVVSAAVFDESGALSVTAGDNARMAAWGKNSFSGSQADALRYGVVRLQPCGSSVDDLCHFLDHTVTACELDVGAPVWTDTNTPTLIGINIRNQATSTAGCAFDVDDVVLYAGFLNTADANSNRNWLQTAMVDVTSDNTARFFQCWQGQIRLAADYYQSDFSATLTAGGATIWSVVHTGSPGANGGGVFRITGGDIQQAGYVCTDSGSGADFTLTVNDAFGDGLTTIRAGMNQDDVFYRLVVNGNTVVEGFDYGAQEVTNFVPTTTTFDVESGLSPVPVSAQDDVRTVIVGLQQDRFSEAATSVNVVLGGVTHTANHLGLVVQTLLDEVTVQIVDTDGGQVHGYGIWLAKQGDCAPRLPNGARFASTTYSVNDYAANAPCTEQYAFAPGSVPSSNPSLDSAGVDVPMSLQDGEVITLGSPRFDGCTYPTAPSVGAPTCP